MSATASCQPHGSSQLAGYHAADYGPPLQPSAPHEAFCRRTYHSSSDQACRQAFEGNFCCNMLAQHGCLLSFRHRDRSSRGRYQAAKNVQHLPHLPMRCPFLNPVRCLTLKDMKSASPWHAIMQSSVLFCLVLDSVFGKYPLNVSGPIRSATIAGSVRNSGVITQMNKLQS